MKYETPEAWIVSTKISKHDTDNILLSKAPNGVYVEPEFENLLVTGNCDDLTHGRPPSGLQLEMTNGYTAVDTLVMQNLGYFQMKGNPGVWNLRLTEGRANDLYHIITSEKI